MINLLLGLGAALAVILLSTLLSIKLWISVPIGLLAGAGLFIWQGRKIQQDLEKIFTRAGDLLKKQQFDKAIEVMKEGYQFSTCLLYTSPSPRDRTRSRMPSSA